MQKDIKSILKHVKSTNDHIGVIASKVNDLWEGAGYSNLAILKKVAHSKSPLSLNNFGKSVLKEYRGDLYINKNKKELIKKIESQKFKSPYDIQRYSENVILQRLNSDDIIEIKNLIYYKPIYKKEPVTFKMLSIVMGLYLRDMYFEKHPELTQLTTVKA